MGCEAMPILQKKLNKLELDIKSVLGTPPQIAATGDSRQISSGDFEQRCNFLENFLKAEEASCRPNSPEVQDLRQRLTALKISFCNWSENGNSSLQNAEDSDSVCSDCTQAILNDVVEESGAQISDLGHFTEKGVISAANDEEEEETGDETRTCGIMEKYFAVFSCGLIVGAGLALKFLCPREDFPFISDQVHCVPT